jgi:phosphatidate phosphatase LPIN
MKSLYKFFDINSATLSGALDIVAVRQPDGSLACTPFHVRFGKLNVLRSREKVVRVFVNEERVDMQMKVFCFNFFII